MNLKLKERRISGRSTNLLMNQIVKEFIENTPTWVEEEMERLDKYWTEETIKWLKESHDRGILTWKQSSSTRENYKPMQSELENKEEIIKKQIEVIRELNKDKESLVQGTIKLQDQINILSSENNEIKEEIESQDTGIKALIQDWKELREDCATQTKEVKKLKEEKESLIQSTIKLQAKINLMSSMNNELQEEIEELKIKYKELWFTPVLTPYTPPYIVTCTNSTLK